MNPSPNLFLIGPSGAGKTSIGRRLATHYDLPFVDLDQVIVERTGVDIPAIFEIEGEAGFRAREKALLAELATGADCVLATGAGAILDADNRQRLGRHGFVLWLDADIQQQLAHLVHDRRRPLLTAPDRRERMDAMAAVRTPLYAATADLRVQVRNEPVRRTAQRTARALDAAWTRHPAGVATP